MSTTEQPSKLTSINSSNYQIDSNDVGQMHSPSPLVFKELLESNLREMVRIAGSADRLRPHCKTHKMPTIIGMKRDIGITKFKCATIAEAEMLAAAGCENVLIAYQMVGPNIGRLARLIDKFPEIRFGTIVDSLAVLENLAQQLKDVAPKPDDQNCLDVFIDVDPGMHRTGIAPDENAVQLYEAIVAAENVAAAGIHWYDGHIRQTNLDERRHAVDAEYQQLSQLRNQLLMNGFDVPEVIVSGTGAFPIWAEYEEPNMTLSPGTVVFFDAGYAEQFPDMSFQPALAVLTRVVSNNRAGHLTLDLGHKSIAADQPAGRRAYFPQLVDAEEVHHTEEHLVLKTGRADEFKVGDALVALPYHVCPTSNLHQTASVIEAGELVETWPIVGRDRMISI